MTVTIEFVGGPKDGEVAMLAAPIPELELVMPPIGLKLLRPGERPQAKRLHYVLRDGRTRLDGVFFYDFVST